MGGSRRRQDRALSCMKEMLVLEKYWGLVIYVNPLGLFFNPQTAENKFLQKRIFYMGAMLTFKDRAWTSLEKSCIFEK